MIGEPRISAVNSPVDEDICSDNGDEIFLVYSDDLVPHFEKVCLIRVD